MSRFWSIHSEVLSSKSFLKNFTTKLTGKHLYWIVLLMSAGRLQRYSLFHDGGRHERVKKRLQ